MNKAEYREYFRILMSYVKVTKFLPGLRISQSNFSKFLNDDSGHNDDRISIQKLDMLYQTMKETLIKIV